MASNASMNLGLSDLLQTLTNTPALAPILSSPNAMTALENASPSDIVSLSDAATQLQDVTALFGGANPTTDSSADPLSNLFASLQSSSTATSSGENQLVANQTALQQQELATLLGTRSSNVSADPSIDMFG